MTGQEKKYRKRLRNLVKVLELLPKLEGWNSKLGFDLESWKRIYAKPGEFQCGTTACAIGWAASTPWFNSEGLYLEHSLGAAAPTFGNEYGFKAIALFFDMHPRTAARLFLATHYPRDKRTDPLFVAKRVRRYIRKRYGA